MKILFFILGIAFLGGSLYKDAYAIPVLVPLIGVVGVALFKGFFFLTSFLFLGLSAVKKNKKKFAFIGAGALLVGIGVIVIVGL